MKKILQIAIMILIPTLSFAQEIYTLDKSIDVALQKSFGITNAKYSLVESEKKLEAFKASLYSKLDLEFDLPNYSNNLTSQFNPATGKEEFYSVGSSRIEGRLRLTQPIIYTNGTVSIIGRVFGRDQFGTYSNSSRDYFSNFGISINQPLFTFNNQRANLERSEINLENAKRSFTHAEQNLIYDVKVAFYNLYKLKEDVKISEEKLKQNEESFETAENKRKAGLIAEVEAMQLEVDLASSRNDLLNSKRSFIEEINNFKILLGIDSEKEIDIISNLLYTPITIDDTSAINSALQNRADLLNQENDIYLSGIRVDEVDARRQIKLELNARYGISNNSTEVSSLYNDLLDDVNIALTLSVPVWDWGQNSMEVEASQANAMIEQITYNNLKKRIQNDVIAAINRINAAKARVEVLSRSVDIAEKSYNISTERFKSGTISSFDLAQIQLRLTEAKNNSLGALIDYNLAIADLERKTYVKYY